MNPTQVQRTQRKGMQVAVLHPKVAYKKMMATHQGILHHHGINSMEDHNSEMIKCVIIMARTMTTQEIDMEIRNADHRLPNAMTGEG